MADRVNAGSALLGIQHQDHEMLPVFTRQILFNHVGGILCRLDIGLKHPGGLPLHLHFLMRFGNNHFHEVDPSEVESGLCTFRLKANSDSEEIRTPCLA